MWNCPKKYNYGTFFYIFVNVIISCESTSCYTKDRNEVAATQYEVDDGYDGKGITYDSVELSKECMSLGLYLTSSVMSLSIMRTQIAKDTKPEM